MKVLSTKLQDVKIIETEVFGDQRGFFTESWTKKKFSEANLDIDFIQDNHSLSAEPGVLRGLHFQRPPYTQLKLLRVTTGVIYDVLVDLRLGSPTYGQSEGYILSAYNHRQLLVPKGFAHGFLTLTGDVNVQYKVDTYYEASSDDGIAFDDPDLNIDWPMPKSSLILSEKDKHHVMLKDLDNPFKYQEKLK